jgi:ferredoxin
MAYVVAEPCIGTKDRACVEVCPVSCFYENEDQLFIHPQECIDCDACVPVCPVSAIFPEAQVPAEWKFFTQKAIDYFAENAGVKAAKSKSEVGSGGVAEGSTHWSWKGQPDVAAKPPPAAATPADKLQAPPEPATATAHATSSAVVESPSAPAPPQPTAVPATAHAATATVAEVAAAAPKPAAPPVTTQATAATVAEAAAAPAPPKPAPAAPAATAPAAKPAAKPAPPPPKPMDPDEYRRLHALLYQLMEMLGGSRPFDVAAFSEAEEAGRRLKKEVAVEFGKDVYVVSELEKKGMTLRQKHDLAQGLLQAVGRAQFIPQYRGKRQRFMQLAAGGAVTGLISALCGVLSLQTVRIDSLLTSPKPGLSEMVQAFLNPESLIPFLSFQMIAGLFGLFTIFAISRCWRVIKEVHELKRAMQAKQLDPRLIARMA